MSMNTYVIEREVPGAGQLTGAELHTIATKSNSVIAQMGSRLQWVTSWVTGDKLYCIYRADNAEMIYEHARIGGFPANVVVEATATFDPTTGD